MGFDLDDRTDELLMRVQRELNVQLERQYDQLAQSLSDFVYSVFSDPHEPPWQEELTNFSEYWSERGLRLTQRTLDGLERLIRDEVENADDRRPLDEFNARTDESEVHGIFLAAAPRGRGGNGNAGKGNASGAGSGAPRRGAPATKRFPRGNWIKGAEGNGVLELAEPVKIDANLIVTHVEFIYDKPILDPWSMPGDDQIIALTGNNSVDQSEAKKMWAQSHTGELDAKYMFHHDGNVTQTIKYRGQSVLVGRMQRIPTALNRIAHSGSAAVARSLGVSSQLAKEINELARKGKGPLIKVKKQISRAIAASAPRLGRTIPIIGGLISLYFFADDVEAHGLGGAVLRATPLLGDIVTAYDLGSALAAEIERRAQEDLADAYTKANESTLKAHAAAQTATTEAFNVIGANLRITKEYITPDEILDAIREPLAEFYGEVFTIHARKYEAKANESRPTDAEIKSRVHSARQRLEQELRRGLQQQQSPAPHQFG